MATYLERDLHRLINIRDLKTFQLFLRICAARTGQLLNLSALSSDCVITHHTAKAWFSVLKASYLQFLLPPKIPGRPSWYRKLAPQSHDSA